MPSSGSASKSVSSRVRQAATGRMGWAWLSMARIDVMYRANDESIGAWATSSPRRTKAATIAIHQQHGAS
jgi:hypothetical protein